jgi:hypothetical protein
MKCAMCGVELQPGSDRCGQCGNDRTKIPGGFLEVERRFANLRSQFQQGQISFANYQTACQDLTLSDENGAAWRFNIADREWYRMQNSQWLRADPTPHIPKAPAAQPPPAALHRTQEPQSPAKPRRGLKGWQWAAIGCGGATLVVGVTVVVIFGGSYLSNLLKGKPEAQVSESTPTAASSLPSAQVLMVTGTAFGEQFKASNPTGTEVKAGDEGYCITLGQANTHLFAPNQQKLTHLGVDVTAALAGGPESSEYGLLISASGSDGGGGIILSVNGLGQWRVQSAASDGTLTNIQPWSDSPALAQGSAPNRLSVLLEEKTLYYFANGEELWRNENVPAGGDTWGLWAASAEEGSGQVCFNELRAEEVFASPQDDRQIFLSQFGEPDTFTLFFDENEDGSLYRHETWGYADELTELTFLDGVLVNDEAVEYSTTTLFAPSLRYHPMDFQAGMTLEQVKALLDNIELVSAEVLPELGGNAQLYGGEQILIGFNEGKLVYVETFALSEENEEVVP